MFLDDEDPAPPEKGLLASLKTWITALALVGCLVMFVGINAPKHQAPAPATLAADTLAPDPMPTASTPAASAATTRQATALIARHVDAIVPIQMATATDRLVWMGLLAASFVLMAIGSRALWRRSLKDLARAMARRRDV